MTMDGELESILRAGSKTFHLASLALPRRVRAPTLVLYAFCRRADDAVDEATSANEARAAIGALREQIERIYERPGLGDALERALVDVVRTSGIPRSELELLVEGMEWDVEGRRYEELDEVRAYARRVAGTVGVMMTHLMGAASSPGVLNRACDLGVAMQLTNIARDVGADARIGRVYLPSRWLEEEGGSAEALLANPAATPAVRRTVERLLEVADSHYRRADEGIGHLPADCRIAIRAARLVYAEIGEVIRAHSFDTVSDRAVVRRRKKLALLVRATAARWWEPRPLAANLPAEALR